MKLPDSEKVIIPKAKITDYLLSLKHRDGCSKAKFFLRFGFSQEKWKTFALALKQHAVQHEIAGMEKSNFGKRYIIEGTLVSLDERNPSIRSVWFIKHGTDQPIFVTAYPLKGKTT
ncbi:MAG: hypothetical protein HQM14_18805 [SAR324 cluster bacterium]|nr:hypothetical protein [SAR324 cluster bacterium]